MALLAWYSLISNFNSEDADGFGCGALVLSSTQPLLKSESVFDWPASVIKEHFSCVQSPVLLVSNPSLS